MTCELCDALMTFRIYAAYNADEGENAHPRHARYPMAMARTCAAHLADVLARDADAPGSTQQWLIVRIV